MKQFFERYKSATFALVQFAIIAHYLITVKYGSAIERQLSGDPIALFLVREVIAGTGIWVALAWLPSLAYEKLIWPALNMKTNFGGVWRSEVKYEGLERPSTRQQEKGINSVPDGMNFDVIIHIEQSPTGLAMLGNSETPNEHFRAVLTGIGDDGVLRVVYEIVRSADSEGNWPEEVLGVEYMQPSEWDRFGRPKKLTTHFWHCARPNHPLYRGSANMTRLSRKELRDIRNMKSKS